VISRPLVVLLFLLVHLTRADASVTRITLKELVDGSDLIVVATVTKVEHMPPDADLREELDSPFQVATARVVEVWKGNAGPEIRYISSPTWMCDISGAEPGERVVLFLTKQDSERFLLIEHAGRGRMPIRDVNGQPHATIWVDDVQLPSGIATIPGPKPERELIRSVEVSDLRDAICPRTGIRSVRMPFSVAVALVAATIVLLRRISRR